MPALNLALLGQFEGSLDSQPLGRFRTLRAQALLVYLTTEFALGASHQRRESLMELLWPGMPPDSARTNLRQNLYYLRRTVPNASMPDSGKAIPFLLSDRQSVAVNPHYPLEFDVQQFSDLLAGPQAKWPQAAALYRGDFLTDFYLVDANPFEEWAAARREAFRRQVLNALEGLTTALVMQHQLIDAEGYARRQLTIEPLRESAYRQLMKVLYWSGRRAEALSLYQECVRILEDELDAPPSAATTELAEAIREGTLDGLPEVGVAGERVELASSKDKPEPVGTQELISEALPPAEQEATIRSNLPVFATPFIGRETELRTLEDFITDPNARLITIVGPGGIGKTRLASAAAARSLKSGIFPDGLCFIDLVPLQGKSQIIRALAEAMNFPLQERDDDSSWKQLLKYLRQKRMLFLFDSFEHLIDCADLAAELANDGPDSKVLVTSRERLNLKLEQVYPIEGLAFPDQMAEKDAVDYAALRLFVQSASRIQPDYALDDEDRSCLIRICRMVAGMPLALELAASWVDMLSLEDIASELQQGLNILETELRDVPERQRSVQASFEYSWRKLDEAEQKIFTQLSIFRGGFSRAAAEEVAGASLRQLSHLVNKSLIKVDRRRHRYSVHNLLRQFGADKLTLQPVLEAATCDRHSDYYCRLLAGYTDDLKGAGQAQALSAIEADIENVRLAWNHASSQGNFEAIDMALESLWRFYWNSGRRDLREFEVAIADLRKGEIAGARGIVLGRLLAPMGRSYASRGDTAKAKETLEESLELLQQLGAVEESLISLLFLAEVQGSLEESRRNYEEGLALAKEFNDAWAIGHALLYLGWNSRLTGNYQDAEQHSRDAINQFDQNGDIGGICASLRVLSLVAVDRGQYEEGLATAEEIISASKGFNPGFRAMSLFPLGYVHLALGNYQEAEAYIRQGRSLAREFGREEWARNWLFWMGEISFARNEYSRASQQYQDSLVWAVETKNNELFVLNQNALGRLAETKGNTSEARNHFLTALSTGRSLDRAPILLDCLVNIASLFIKEGDFDYAASLAIFATEHPASRAMTKERGGLILAQTDDKISPEAMKRIHRRSQTIVLDEVVSKLLLELDST